MKLSDRPRFREIRPTDSLATRVAETYYEHASFYDESKK